MDRLSCFEKDIQKGFVVGDYVIIKKEYSDRDWYHTDPMLILDIKSNLKKISKTNGVISKTNGVINNNYIHCVVDYVFTTMVGSQKLTNSNIDFYCIELSPAHIRHDKLERILGD